MSFTIQNRRRGSGLFKRIANRAINLVAKPDVPGFPGEFHSVLKVPNKGLKRASYCGPNTQLLKRLKRGDKPLTPVDQVCMRHDAAYFNLDKLGLSKMRDMDILAQATRDDNKFLHRIAKIRNTGKDSRFNTIQPEVGIKAKLALENLGILKRTSFISSEEGTPEEKAFVKRRVQELKQSGFGNVAESDLFDVELPPPLPEDPLRRLRRRLKN